MIFVVKWLRTKLIIKLSCRLYTVDVVSFNEVSRVRPYVNRDSGRIMAV